MDYAWYEKVHNFWFNTLAFALFYFGNKTGNLQGNKALPQQYLVDRTNYTKAIQFFNDAMDLTKPPDNSNKPFDMPKDQEQKILTGLSGGISLSKKVNDSFLDYLHPELKDHYRNQYVRGYELILEGFKKRHIQSKLFRG